MECIKKFLITLAVISLPMFFFSRPIAAQDTETSFDSQMQIYDSTVSYDDLDFDTKFDDIMEVDFDSELPYGEFENLIVIFTRGILLFILVTGLATYIYSAITLQKTAEKLNMENTWFAWLPILNTILLFKMGGQNPLYILFGLIPIFGPIILLVFGIIATMDICEKRGYDKMLGLLLLVPVGSLILWGMLAWGKKENSTPLVAPTDTPATPPSETPVASSTM